MSNTGATAQVAFNTAGYAKARKDSDDPYIYQVGFGNQFSSQAIPGVLPEGQNSPQKCKYDLYAECITGTPFTSPRKENQHNWVYRVRPTVEHDEIFLTKQNPLLESDFSPSNLNVHVNATQVNWKPFQIPSPGIKTDFIEGLKTLGGNGSAVSKDGLAFHIYTINASMEKTAFVNNDGDFLFVPHQGRLDIQTELGRIMVAPGEIAVVQSGIRFKVSLPDGTARGDVYEVYGQHFALPELGPLGANGMANVRDFEHPVASFDIDESVWCLVYKIGGKLFEYKQNHTPFDVVAWHGNYIPYKYWLDKFILVQNVNKDHADPSIYCVLKVNSKWPGISLMEFCVLPPRVEVTTDTFRPAFFHRNCAAEYAAFIRGGPGGHLGYSGFMPHGITTAEWLVSANEELTPKMAFEGMLLTLLEPYQMLLLTEFAVKSNEYQVADRKVWKFKPGFLSHLDEINAELKSAGLPQVQGQV